MTFSPLYPRRTVAFAGLLIGTYLTLGCGAAPDQAAASQASATPPESFELSPEAITQSELAFETAGKHEMRISVSVPGRIAIDEERSVQVVSPLAGTTREVRVQLGQMVKPGDVLCVLDSRELADASNGYLAALTHADLAREDQARAVAVTANTTILLDLLAKEADPEQIDATLKNAPIGETRALLIAAYARYRAAKATFTREKDLHEKRISPAADYAVADEEYAAARARYTALIEDTAYGSDRSLKVSNREAAQAALDLTASRQKLLALGLGNDDLAKLGTDQERVFTRYEIRSPIAGTVLDRRVALGQAIPADHQVFFIADLSQVMVHLAIPADRLPRLTRGQKVVVGTAASTDQAHGELEYLGPIIDEQTGVAVGRTHIPNPDLRWRPGMNVTVECILEEFTAAVAIPKDAIQVIGDGPVVFVQQGNRFLVRKVALGRSDAAVTEILSGLADGDRCVVGNSFVLKAHLFSLGGR